MADHALDDAAYRVPVGADFLDVVYHRIDDLRIPGADDVRFDFLCGDGGGIDVRVDVLDGADPCKNLNAGAKGIEHLPCDCAGSDATDRFAGGSASTA